ncbi:MAG: CinA family protein [Actinomycetaceae bacterium]|nr:CinA family protein [Arcanobacterium sp.]MDD7504848.1 CinA family protein [Actinomycetaceae bacterium]MDY6142794.1 CinA family protein [Arcanobacterium sp.]
MALINSPYRDAIADVASRIVDCASEAGIRISVAESLTGGALASAIVDIPGASAVLLGGVVSYAEQAKAQILHVSAERLNAYGAVDPVVARQMASGVRRLFGADYAVSTTGVAGPGASEGHEEGEVHIGFACEQGVEDNRYLFDGDRDSIRAQSVLAALRMLAEKIGA